MKNNGLELSFCARCLGELVDDPWPIPDVSIETRISPRSVEAATPAWRTIEVIPNMRLLSQAFVRPIKTKGATLQQFRDSCSGLAEKLSAFCNIQPPSPRS